MTTAEQIAMEEYPDLFIRDDKMKTSGTALISDAAQMLRREGCVRGYTLGQQDRWIPVSERLPGARHDKEPNDIPCLIVRGREVEHVSWSCYHQCWDGADADDFLYSANDARITHWMPLPSPPNPEQR